MEQRLVGSKLRGHAGNMVGEEQQPMADEVVISVVDQGVYYMGSKFVGFLEYFAKSMYQWVEY